MADTKDDSAAPPTTTTPPTTPGKSPTDNGKEKLDEFKKAAEKMEAVFFKKKKKQSEKAEEELNLKKQTADAFAEELFGKNDDDWANQAGSSATTIPIHQPSTDDPIFGIDQSEEPGIEEIPEVSLSHRGSRRESRRESHPEVSKLEGHESEHGTLTSESEQANIEPGTDEQPTTDIPAEGGTDTTAAAATDQYYDYSAYGYDPNYANYDPSQAGQEGHEGEHGTIASETENANIEPGTDEQPTTDIPAEGGTDTTAATATDQYYDYSAYGYDPNYANYDPSQTDQEGHEGEHGTIASESEQANIESGTDEQPTTDIPSEGGADTTAAAATDQYYDYSAYGYDPNYANYDPSQTGQEQAAYDPNAAYNYDQAAYTYDQNGAYDYSQQYGYDQTGAYNQEYPGYDTTAYDYGTVNPNTAIDTSAYDYGTVDPNVTAADPATTDYSAYAQGTTEAAATTDYSEYDQNAAAAYNPFAAAAAEDSAATGTYDYNAATSDYGDTSTTYTDPATAQAPDYSSYDPNSSNNYYDTTQYGGGYQYGDTTTDYSQYGYPADPPTQSQAATEAPYEQPQQKPSQFSQPLFPSMKAHDPYAWDTHDTAAASSAPAPPSAPPSRPAPPAARQAETPTETVTPVHRAPPPRPGAPPTESAATNKPSQISGQSAADDIHDESYLSNVGGSQGMMTPAVMRQMQQLEEEKKKLKADKKKAKHMKRPQSPPEVTAKQEMDMDKAAAELAARIAATRAHDLGDWKPPSYDNVSSPHQTTPHAPAPPPPPPSAATAAVPKKEESEEKVEEAKNEEKKEEKMEEEEPTKPELPSNWAAFGESTDFSNAALPNSDSDFFTLHLKEVPPAATDDPFAPPKPIDPFAPQNGGDDFDPFDIKPAEDIVAQAKERANLIAQREDQDQDIDYLHPSSNGSTPTPEGGSPISSRPVGFEDEFKPAADDSPTPLYDEDDSVPLTEFPKKFTDATLQAYDVYGKIHTVKLQYVQYKERIGIRSGQIARLVEGHITKYGMPIEHAAQVTILSKFGCLNADELSTFINAIEDFLFTSKISREIVPQYKQDEVQIHCYDEYQAYVDKEGFVSNQ
uniref:SHD domain-containing protein n=1 Tax=Panagrolaimus sp. ES5 TaxID=591445 RepID=A0AC34GPI7_9BILA